jgi:hypothetical protein
MASSLPPVALMVRQRDSGCCRHRSESSPPDSGVSSGMRDGHNGELQENPSVALYDFSSRR